MAPPTTPSPHRFLPASSARSQNRSQLPPSTLRRQRAAPSTQQFRPTPRFAAAPLASNQAETIDSPTSSPQVSQAVQPRQNQLNCIEGEENNQDATMASADEAESSGDDDDDDDDDDELLDLMLPPPKRKRLSPSPTPNRRNASRNVHDLVVLSSSPSREPSPPSSPVSPLPQAAPHQGLPLELTGPSVSAHRFQFSEGKAPQTPAAPRIGDRTAPLLKTSRPGFVLPSQEEKGAGPTILPEVFSPHKRGSKVFVPGGMATTVRDWVLALESTRTTRTHNALGGSRRRKGLNQEQDRKIVAASISGEGTGIWTVISSEGEHWLLIGSRGYGGEDSGRLAVGNDVHLKPPTWTVDIEGQKWGVVIAWSIVQ